MPLPSDRLSSWWRTFAVQGSWNYRSLVGAGIAFAMLPLLRRIHAGDPVRLRSSVERHMRSFNAHPYLCPMAVGALARLEHDEEDPQIIERFRSAVRGPLGTVGDLAVWAQWRPLCLLLALAGFGLGLNPVASAAVFLILYNVGHVVVRTWAFTRGWDVGLGVAALLKTSWLERSAARIWPVNMLLLGAVAVLLGARVTAFEPLAVPAGSLIGLGAVAAVLSFRFPRRGGRLAVALLLLAPVIWLLSGRLG